MKLLLDEDVQSRLLVRLLREAGHHVLTVSEAGLEAHTDAEVFALASREGRALLTRNVRDFRLLHEAATQAATGTPRPGLLVDHQERDTSRNLSSADLVRAVGNLAESGWDIAGQFISLNAWAFRRKG